MNAYTMIQSYDTFGGHPTITLLGQLIEEHLANSQHGVVEFESTACLRTNRPPRKTLEDMHAKFHTNLARLPISRWETKKSKLKIQYESRLGLAEDLHEDRSVSQELLSRALVELIEVLERLQPKLKKKKGLNIDEFLTGLRSIEPHVSVSSAELKDFGERQSAKKQTERAKLPWDQQLQIDWDDFHPEAKNLLDDPFFWSQTNAYSPHGNDTGADLLAAYINWNKNHPDASGELFLDNLIDQWGLTENVKKAECIRLEDYGQDEEIAIVVLQEAVVALAFAEIKLRGSCGGTVAFRAREHLEQRLEPNFWKALDWPAPSTEMANANARLLAVVQGYVPEERQQPGWKFWQ